MKNATWLRLAAISIGSAALVGVAGAAVADTEGEVDVNVEITPVEEPGVLALTVEAGSISLTEEGSTELIRQFVGELPTVTVTDTRTVEEIPEGAAWYVVGSSSDFVGSTGQPEIAAGHLGWSPRLVEGSDAGLVAEGDTVETVLDDSPNAVGLVDQEFLAIAADSGAVAEEGSWSATADLFLRTPATVEPGSYSATLTLSLFE